MRIAVIQTASPDHETPQARLQRVAQTVGDLQPGIDLVVLPELWRVGFNHFDDYDRYAEDPDGPTVTTLAGVAAERGCHVHVGSFVERTRFGGLRNTAALIGPEGSVLHRYSKVHVFGYQSREAELLTAGTSVEVVDAPWGRTAATTCYDLRFPGLWQQLVRRDARVVIVPAAWPAARLEHWRLFTSARAVENQIVVIACNAAGSHGGVSLAGHSRVVDPHGTVLAEAGQDEDLLIVDLDPAVVDEARSDFPVLADRLADYDSLTHSGVCR